MAGDFTFGALHKRDKGPSLVTDQSGVGAAVHIKSPKTYMGGYVITIATRHGMETVVMSPDIYKRFVIALMEAV